MGRLPVVTESKLLLKKFLEFSFRHEWEVSQTMNLTHTFAETSGFTRGSGMTVG